MTSDLRSLPKDQLIELKWHRGALKFLLRPHQIPIYDAIWDCITDEDPLHTSHTISSARQLGKSFTEVVVAVEYCLRYPKSTVLFAAPKKSQATEIIHGETYFRVFETCPDSLKPKIKDSIILFPNGSRIRVGHTDNGGFDDLRGGAAHLLILDEAGFMSHLDIGILPALQPMLSSTRGKTLFSSTPPPSLEHPYVEIHRRHLEKGYVSQFTIFDNKSLQDADIIKAYEETGSKCANGEYIPSTRFRREYLAEFVMEGSIQLAPDWDDEFIAVSEPNRYHQYHHRYISMDPGTTDFNAGLLGYYDHENQHLQILDEWTYQGQTLNSEVLSTGIKTKIEDNFGTIPVYRMISDNNNLHLLADLKTIYGLPFVGTTKTRLENNRAAQEEGMVTKVNNWLRQGRISIHPRCEMLIGNLRYGTWEEVGQNKRQFARSKVYGHYDHFAALVYLVRNIDERTNPVPHTFGHNTNTFISEDLVLKAPSRDLRRLSSAIMPSRS
jgi:hypothetical protein